MPIPNTPFVLRTWGGTYLNVSKNSVKETTDLQKATVFEGAVPLDAENALFRANYSRHVDRVRVTVTRTVELRKWICTKLP